MEPAIRAEVVSKVFGTRKALDGVSFELPQGSFLSVFGPNGAGKTTLLRVLATLARPSSGVVQIAGNDTKESPDEARAVLGMVSHTPMVYPDLTSEENLVFYAQMYGVADPNRRAAQLLEAVGLGHRRHDAVRTFSRGMVQRVAIARALVHDPAVVLLDEPYAGLDPHAAEVLDHLIAQARDDNPTRTFVMVSHDLQKGLQCASHVMLLARGKVVLFGERRQLDDAVFAEKYRAVVGMGVS